MEKRMPQVSPKQSKVEIDTEAFSKGLAIYQGEVDQIKSLPVMIYDQESLDTTICAAVKAKKTRETIEGVFKPTKELLAAAEKSMKTAIEVFTKPLKAWEDNAREETRKYFELNRETKSEYGRLAGSGKWKLVVNDEDALLKSMFSVTRKKVDGKMVDIIELDPTIRSLFKYEEAKGNALATAMTTGCKLAGCTVQEGETLTLTGEK